MDPKVGVGVSNTDGSFTISAQQLMELLKPAATTYAHTDNPHVGGVNRLGAWTGLGALDEGVDPRSPNCMRRFQAEPLKEHQALKPVFEACVEGVTKESLQFCLGNEPNVSRTCLCIRI